MIGHWAWGMGDWGKNYFTVTNLVDEILAERGFIPSEQIRSITLDILLPQTGKDTYHTIL